MPPRNKRTKSKGEENSKAYKKKRAKIPVLHLVQLSTYQEQGQGMQNGSREKSNCRAQPLIDWDQQNAAHYDGDKAEYLAETGVNRLAGNPNPRPQYVVATSHEKGAGEKVADEVGIMVFLRRK